MTEQESFLRRAMKAHGGAVYRLALCRTQSVPDAEDVYQDVFLRLLGQTAAPEWEAERLKAWLLRTALNRCADLHRLHLRRPVVPLEEATEIAQLEEGAVELWEAVARLPEKLRMPVHLHYAEGYSTEEIAALLGVPAATVRTRLRRARLKLKDLLGGSDDEQESLSEADRPYPTAGGT